MRGKGGKRPIPRGFDDEERPTKRDMATVVCPACIDPRTDQATGRAMIVETLSIGRYRSRRSTEPDSCPLCKGACFVTRQDAEAFRKKLEGP
jgi:hypothetical protein